MAASQRRAPTLYGIIVVKLLKGALFLSMAVVAYALSDNDLPLEYRHLLHYLRLNPERKFFNELALKIGTLTEANVLWVAAGTAVYSLFSLIEGTGLMFRIPWVGWMTIGESAFFIPIEIFDLVHRFSITVFVILFLNVVILWYLFANRERLFRHHAHPGHHRHED